MDRNETIEIPFGAKDSELKGWEYTIPEGMVAEIKDGKIIVREKESEDERIRKIIIRWATYMSAEWIKLYGVTKEEVLAWLEKQGKQNLANSAKTCKDEQNPAWSGEDEIGFRDAMWAIEQARTIAKDENDMGNLWYAERWLKSIKSRVQPQPKSEWSEEDEATISRVISIVKWATYSDHSHPILNDKGATEVIERLKSLKERCTWKPSDEQMSVLFSYAEQNNTDGSVLRELYNDLKKQKG